MKLAFIDVQNFRKLKQCRIEFSDEQTIFVGANNSGKTSAMDALSVFLKKKCKNLSARDFTLSNWSEINKLGSEWINKAESNNPDFRRAKWLPYIPTLDVWLNVNNSEIHYISHLIPTLEWKGGKLGVRLVYEPEDRENLYKAYSNAYIRANEVSGDDNKFHLWPESLRDFLEKENQLSKYFIMRAYILDPSKSEGEPQLLQEDAASLDNYPFKGLFKIDEINAQRGFADPNAEGGVSSDRRLSAQLQKYFDNHLNPTELPDNKDVLALKAIDTAHTEFDKMLNKKFHPAIGELRDMNYPGFNNPQIHISSKVDPLEGLNHDSAVQFNVQKNALDSADTTYCLPEQYNGLGYQNLISMIFNLIRFRDERMLVGKAKERIDDKSEFKKQSNGIAHFIEPLHIVLIEEPEVHLHAQAQQVFIKKAYDVLRKHPDMENDSDFSTQLVISTHSSHVAHEIDFTSLRYFKRSSVVPNDGIPTAELVNLSEIFGDEDETSKFATRYLKTTHCDLFFADAVILVEGSAERMLVPHFIRECDSKLNRCYLCLLEIGGSHAHKLKPLIEALGLFTLIITDIDSKKGSRGKKVRPVRGKNYLTGNHTIKEWVPKEDNLDKLLDMNFDDKVKDKTVRVAYQYEMDTNLNGKKSKAIPYTFEDAIVLANIEFFKNQPKSTGLMKKMAGAVNEQTRPINEICDMMFKALSGNSKKAEMALDLLCNTGSDKLEPPKYIKEGLIWLEEKLCSEEPTTTEGKN